MKKAVCVFSGGLDSTATASYLKHKGYQLYLLSFDYGQRARNELYIGKELASILKAEYKMLDITFMKELYGNSNLLTNDDGEIPSMFNYNIVVPIRNAVFLTIASAYAFSIKADIVAYGAHLDDEPNYPDCRKSFAKTLEHALNLAEEDGINTNIRNKIEIWSPAVEGLSKRDLVRLGYKLLGDNIFRTWSCYNNLSLHCGRCESCMNRMKAFKDAGIKDQTIYLNIKIKEELR